MRLGSLYDPAALAVVGASADPAKWGHWIAHGALAGSPRREVHLVNPAGGVVLGRRAFPCLADIPGPLDTAVIVTPPTSVLAVATEALDAGAANLVVITGSVGDGSEQDEHDLVRLVRARGARLLGPNCMGLVDPGNALELSWGEFPVGDVAMVSQSGNLGLEVGRLLRPAGLGFSRFVSIGNQRDITAAELIDDLVDHDGTRVVAVYLESVVDPAELLDALARARAADKPVVLLAAGASAAAARAASSHTGAILSSTAVVAAACERVGAIAVETPGELVDAVAGLRLGRPAGSAVALICDSGGQGAVGADALERAGLHLPSLGAQARAALQELLPRGAAVDNPIDLAGAGETDLDSYRRAVELTLADPSVDSVVLSGYFGDYAAATPGLLARETEVAHALGGLSTPGHPVVVHSMSAGSTPLDVLRGHGLLVTHRIEHGARALAAMHRWSGGQVSPVARIAPSSVLAGTDYLAVRAALLDAGVTFPPALRVTDRRTALAAAEDIGFPVVLKVLGHAHKTEVGGVVLGLADPGALGTAFDQMDARLRAEGYVVEAMHTDPGVELIVGGRRDPNFGATVMVGLGGVTAELRPDVAVDLAPVDRATARRLVLSLASAPLLTGWRGSAPLDVDAPAEVVRVVSELMAADLRLCDVELNPVRVTATGAVALDATASWAATV